MAKFSTGLRNSIAVTGSLTAALADGKLNIYKGATIPASPDDVLPGDATLMYTFTVDNDGTTLLDFAATATNGVLLKSATQSWQGVAAAAGDMSFFRYYVPADDGETASTTAVRVQGTVGTAFADLIVANVTKAISDPLTIDYFGIAIPEGS